MTSEEIRADFLAFFEERGHTIVPSAPLVPQNDPTLLFTNAGMNQFKDVFLGLGTRPYTRAADTQKCLRVSGKHNDLEEVGHDTYHHTFFEMLGNWSFGDYFKREAIRWAWELLVDRWGLSPDRLYATVHEGDEELGLEPDNESLELWKTETSIPHDHILYGSTKDNFWMMGDTGPCGPCTEIHIDLRPDEERKRVPGRQLVNQDHPLVIEIWNLVFIQYNALPDGSLEPLPARHVDTGMGFERIVAVLQGKTSNYDTDLFAPILQRLAELSPLPHLKGYDAIEGVDETQRERIRIAMRVVADHIRAIAFAIADGVMPGNVGRGYVIRRILRRAVRYGYQTLGFRGPFLYQLVEPLAGKMGDTFPEIRHHQSYIERMIRAEEESFLTTLEAGLEFFERIVPYIKTLHEHPEQRKSVREQLLSDRKTLDLLEKAYVDSTTRDEIIEQFLDRAIRGEIPGEVAFLLHDTYGFPIDLTQLMAREEGLSVHLPRFEELMQRQKERARAATLFKGAYAQLGDWQVISSGEDSRFVGYDMLRVDNARIRRIRKLPADTQAPSPFQIVLDVTPFYAESGGQVGDTGYLIVDEEEIRVLDTQREQGHIVHYVNRFPQNLTAPVTARVDTERRLRIQKHHTATHLLHAALREILGPHVRQQGSLVAPDRLRFDFTHYERVSPDQLREIEWRVNEVIQRNIEKQEEREVPLDEALAWGAMALFGEKYGEKVRVITFDPNFSIELCGGTHVEATGEIGLFTFISEGSVASGIRRVEALAGMDAVRHVQEELASLEHVRAQFQTSGRPIEEEVERLLQETRELRTRLARAKEEALLQRLQQALHQARQVGPVKLITARLDDVDMSMLRTLAQQLQQQAGDGSVVVLGSALPEEGKAYLVVAVAGDLVAELGIKAGDLVKHLATIIGGGGGGRPNLATAGGKQVERLDEALAAAEEFLLTFVSA